MFTKSSINYSKYISTSTRSFFDINKSEENPIIIAENIGFLSEMLANPEQIHSNKVQYIDSPGEYVGIDGLITDNPDITLNIRVADCVPVYLYARDNQTIGLIHSGWKGTTEGIINNTLQKMLELGAIKNNINIFLGPSIGFCCYDVSKDVANHFDIKCKKEIGNKKWKVGLREQIYFQLINNGIPVTNIKVSNICTFEESDYHSYRRDGSKAGRMYAFLGIKS